MIRHWTSSRRPCPWQPDRKQEKTLSSSIPPPLLDYKAYHHVPVMRSLSIIITCCVAGVFGLSSNLPETCRGTIPTPQPPSRRTFLASMASTSFATILGFTQSPMPSAAEGSGKLPMITTDEFLLVLRDSSRSIAQVDIYNNARVVVRLLDGTAFGLSDVVESSTDPRSTLKVAALCREYKVPCKFVDIEAALLNTASTKRKNYANSRVQEAATREKEKLERMQRDEEARLLELQRLQQSAAQTQ